jgi:hypothetical protein
MSTLSNMEVSKPNLASHQEIQTIVKHSKLNTNLEN